MHDVCMAMQGHLLWADVQTVVPMPEVQSTELMMTQMPQPSMSI